ncbi:MFS transporter [Lactiplantibacillus pentosus]|uniref:OFA family MFS transporter n=1 Tax=Lactiplantibacillus pentosus TaxID=1589 RepID=UPI0021A85FAD|nr:OFA family MFS transporter [Lactiplantibacillus pentosus]MCT3285008.1 MFS transporter [Lactiplantibacillus pentosus]
METTNIRKVHRSHVFTAAFFIIFCCAASSAFSVFSIPLQQATGGTESQVALTLTLYQFFMACFGVASGHIMDKFGAKKLMYFGGLIFGLGWFLTAFVHNLFFLYLTVGLMAGAGNGIMYNPALLTALKWFPEKRGTISGLLLGAASLGPLVLAKAGAILCNSYGMMGFVPIGIAYLVICWAVGWMMDTPEEQQTQEAQIVSDNNDFTPQKMLKTWQFWALLLLFSISCTAGIMLIGSLSMIAQIQLSMTPVVAANMVVINTLANFGGRLLTGKLVDKFGQTETLAGILILTIIGLAGLRFSANIVTFVIFLVLLGASFGGVLVVYPTLTGNTFGQTHSGINYGLMFFGYAIGALVGPQIAALFTNKTAGITAYYPAYLVAIGVAAVGLVIDLILMLKGIGTQRNLKERAK